MLDVGDQLTLRFQEEAGLSVRGRVVRADSTPLGPTAGIAFEPLQEEERALFARLEARIDEATASREWVDPVRGSPRRALPPGAVRLRLTPRSGPALTNLRVRELSEGGLGAMGPTRALAKLGEGSSVSCVLSGADEELQAEGEVVHVLKQDGELSLVGLRFFDLSPATRLRLVELISLWGGPKKAATRKPAASKIRR